MSTLASNEAMFPALMKIIVLNAPSFECLGNYEYLTGYASKSCKSLRLGLILTGFIGWPLIQSKHCDGIRIAMFLLRRYTAFYSEEVFYVTEMSFEENSRGV